MAKSTPRILMFVCSGNTCRSPIAEGFTNYFLKNGDHGPDWHACSAGTLASCGIPASDLAVRVMAEHGVDISRHRSSPLGSWTPPEGTLFFGMTRAHKDEIARIFPRRASSIFLLGEISAPPVRGVPAEVPDPYGSSIASYRKTAAMIRSMILSLLTSLGKDPRFLS
ncbi:MAG: low molecular weight protein arginine phosphatase [Thermovirgaceae bacterium]|nr:low molecular weight protein arginine phosphatase [Thermovirgaceae bacterium]